MRSDVPPSAARPTARDPGSPHAGPRPLGKHQISGPRARNGRIAPRQRRRRQPTGPAPGCPARVTHRRGKYAVAPPSHGRRLSPGRVCQGYPPFVPRQLSPAVDNVVARSPQMWTSPGEIDVDRHTASHLCPPPVEECGLPVEGSGDDEPVAFRRYPQGGGQTRWITGG
jgi:hypothetical protein